MALVLADRVQDITLTTGTGTITLANTPPTGFQSFAVIGNGNTTYYTISGGSDWEVGIGTYISASTALSRDTVLSSSNNGNLVNFGAGEKTVFVTYPAEKSVNEDAAGNVNIDITGNAATATRATNLYDGAAGSIPYQTGANTTSFVAAASGVLVGGTTPSFSTAPTLTGTNFTGIPNAALSNNTITIGTTGISLGATSLTLAGLTSVTLTQDPVSNLQVATKQYVDGLVSSGFHYHSPVKYELVTPQTVTYNNGTAGVGATLTNAGTKTAFTPDGIVASVGDRILVYQQANAVQNGVYVVTTVGDGSTNWVLTRSSDANTYSPTSPNGLGGGDAFFVTSGLTGAGETYECNNVGTITFGTTPITFVQIADTAIYSAGTGLTLTGTEFSLTSPVATTLGGTGLTTFGAANRALYSTGTTTLTAGTLPTSAGGTGHTTFTDGQILIGRSSDGSLEKSTITAGTSISITNGSGAITITNTAPDQVVSLTGGGTTVITGSYPNFNITSADQYVGTVTSVSASTNTTGTDVAVAVTNSTTTPAIAISIPSASASARGALTSSDWSTFNAKQAALVSGTNIKTINGSSILGSGDLSTLNTPLAVVGNSTAGAEIRLPEDTDNGSNYVALKAPDNLAANLTLTLPTADGTSGQVLQTNGSGQLAFATPSAGGTQTFTSSGSITAGQAVSLNSNGTVSTTTGVNQSETWGSVTTGTGYSTSNARSVGFFDTNTSWHIHAYQDSSSGSVYVYAFKLNSSGAVSASSTVTLPSPGGIVPRMSLCKGSTGNVYALMYTSDSLGNSIRFFEMANTSTGTLFSKNAISFGGAQNNAAWGDCYYDTNADRVVAFYNDGSAALGIIAINYNSNSPTSTATSSTSLGTTIGSQASLAAAYNSATNTGRVFYGNPSASYYGVTRTVTLNGAGTSFTVGSAVTFNTNNFQYGMRAAYFPSIDRFVIQGLVNSYTAFVTYTIVPSTGNTENGDSTTPSGTSSRYGSYGFSAGYDFTNNVVYNTDANGNLTVFSYTLSTSSIIYKAGTATTDSGTYDWIGCPGTSIDPTNVRVAVTAVSNSQARAYLRGYIPAAFSTTANKFVGFSTQTVSTGQSVTVTTLGGVNTNQSGLTTGTDYYLQFNGVLSTTPSAYGVVAKALSATSAQVITGGAFKKLLSQTVISGGPASITLTLPAGYSQFEVAFQGVYWTATAYPYIYAKTSGGTNIYVSGRGSLIYSSSTTNYLQGGTYFYLSGAQTHNSYSPLGGSLLLQSSSSYGYWTYQMMMSFTNSGDAYYGSTGYLNDTPTSLFIANTSGNFGAGVITLYGIG